MPYGIDNETEEWLKGLEKKLYAKLKTQCLRLGSIMPYVPEHGCYYDMGARELTAWTNGFYAGMLWQMYHAFKEEEFRRAAEGIEVQSGWTLYPGLEWSTAGSCHCGLSYESAAFILGSTGK